MAHGASRLHAERFLIAHSLPPDCRVALQVPIYSFKESKRVGFREQEVPKSRIVILEGIYALSQRIRHAADPLFRHPLSFATLHRQASMQQPCGVCACAAFKTIMSKHASIYTVMASTLACNMQRSCLSLLAVYVPPSSLAQLDVIYMMHIVQHIFSNISGCCQVAAGLAGVHNGRGAL